MHKSQRNIIALALVAILVIPFSTNAQIDSSIFKWFKKNQISVRKSFASSSKDEAKPASFLWFKTFNKDVDKNREYTNIDFGVKFSELPIAKNSTFLNASIYPKLEWHRDQTDASSEKNSLNVGFNFEALKSRRVTPQNASNKFLLPFFTLSADYKNDYVKKLETIEFKGYVSLWGNGSLAPGSLKRSNNNSFFRYYPYAGLESFTSNKTEHKSALLWTCRFYFELYPINVGSKQYFQIIGDYSYRGVFKDDLYNFGSMNWFTIGLNYYPDGMGNIGLGLDYNVGNDPSNSFTYIQNISTGLRLKF